MRFTIYFILFKLVHFVFFKYGSYDHVRYEKHELHWYIFINFIVWGMNEIIIYWIFSVRTWKSFDIVLLEYVVLLRSDDIERCRGCNTDWDKDDPLLVHDDASPRQSLIYRPTCKADGRKFFLYLLVMC